MNQPIDVARTAYAALAEMSVLLAYLEAGNARSGAARISRDTAPIAAILHKAAVARLVNVILRMNNTEDPDRASLAPAFTALADGATFAAVAEGGDPVRLRQAMERWTALRNDPALATVRGTRDVGRERFLPDYANLPPAVYDGFVAAAAETLRTIADLAAGTGVAMAAIPDPVPSARRAQADAYWAALART